MKLGGRLQALWAYRGFVLGMVARDFRGRYLGSVLGASWIVLQPALLLSVYLFVYLVVFKMKFFRRKDVADVEQILLTQRESLDATWIEGHLEQLFGRHDPRVTQWNELRKEAGLA